MITEFHVGGASGRQREQAWLNAVCGVEEYQRVVICYSVIGGIESSCLQIEIDS